MSSTLVPRRGKRGKNNYEIFLSNPANAGKTEEQWQEETAASPLYQTTEAARLGIGVRRAFRLLELGYPIDFTLDPSDTLTPDDDLNVLVAANGGRYKRRNITSWYAVVANELDGTRVVQKVVDWAGGIGTKPPTGKYIGPSGYVDTAAEAFNITLAGTLDSTARNRLDVLEVSAPNLMPDPKLRRTTPGVDWLSSLTGESRSRWTGSANFTKTSSGFTFTGSGTTAGVKVYLDEANLAPGDTVTASYEVFVGDTGISRSVRTRMAFYDVANTLISTTAPSNTNLTAVPSTLKDTAVIPANTSYISVNLNKNGGTSQDVFVVRSGLAQGSLHTYGPSVNRPLNLPQLGGAFVSNGKLTAEVTQGLQLTSRTEDANGLLVSGNVLWEDGSTGVLTYSNLNTAWRVYDTFTVTHALSGKTVSQTITQRNALGQAVPSALVVS